jgi:hypothetical protein
MAERFFARLFGIENASTEMYDLETNQGVVKSTITVYPVDKRVFMVTFYNDIPVVTETGTTTYEGGATKPDWDDVVTVTDGDHASGYTLTVDEGTLDMNVVGTYTISVVATDASGNASDPLEVDITIEDTTAPVITAGAVSVSEANAGTWVPNGTALDIVDGDVTADLVITYAESDDTPIASLALFQTHLDGLAVDGTAKVIYNVDDAEGNSATEVTQVVTIIA